MRRPAGIGTISITTAAATVAAMTFWGGTARGANEVHLDVASTSGDRVIAKRTATRTIDHARQGPSLGDQVVSSYALFGDRKAALADPQREGTITPRAQSVTPPRSA